MRAIIYQFIVKENQAEEFIESWKEMTELIYAYEHSLGSRLHKKDSSTFIAYAQWPDSYTFENAGKNLPEKADQVRQKMRDTCINIEKLMELDVVEDLLR
jgi:heme-degrading monooxygenase HmoA